jgi:alpha-D-xyloside xylohydrolase
MIVWVRRWARVAAVAVALTSTEGLLAQTITREADGVQLQISTGTLRVRVLSSALIRVSFAKNLSSLPQSSPAIVPFAGDRVAWSLNETADVATLATSKLRVEIDKHTARVRFLDINGRQVLAEKQNGRSIEGATEDGHPEQHVAQVWLANQNESLYGLGQQQLGTIDIKGYDLDLWQRNTNVVVPLLVSSSGYGIFWDNLSFTRFGDLRPFERVPATVLLNREGTPGGLSLHEVGSKELLFPSSIPAIEIPPGAKQTLPNLRWEGFVDAPVTGTYQFRTYSNGGIKVWLDGKLVIDHWRQNWLTEYDQVQLPMEAGKRYAAAVETDAEQQSTMHFEWKTPAANDDTSLWSEAGSGVDYYFLYGPRVDDVIARFRTLTGKATMLPNWAFGLWQSRQRYETAQQSLDVVNEFRRRKIPFDAIVQDWQYWSPDSWGSHAFDPVRFPDPDGWIRQIHDQHAHLMISVWGKFNPDTANGKEMMERGFLYKPNLDEHLLDWIGYPYSFYDAFNAEARKLFWSQIDTALFRKGVDAWWMDASEPDLLPSPPTLTAQRGHLATTAMGSGAEVLNGYALMNSDGVYSGQRASESIAHPDTPNQRVFILTRSGYAGQQRYSTVTWSGDITSTWTALAKQIPAALGMSISGLPYWTMDTGGYTMQRRFAAEQMKPEDAEEWRELNVRWFELSTFTPLLRVHGELRPREMWTLGDESSPAYQAELKFDQLRYRMLPYIYSLAGAVTKHDATLMRPLVMDFADDAKARKLTDEYLFGPALLVAPITTYKARERRVYLPPSAKWYDFWTGNIVAGGEATAPAPFDAIPIFVRAGSILPIGPELQYVAEKPEDPLTLYIYSGADADFTLYRDDGLTFAYEKGASAEIPLHWNDRTHVLTIGDRKGQYPGMPSEDHLRIVLVEPGHPSPVPLSPVVSASAVYTGTQISIAVH